MRLDPARLREGHVGQHTVLVALAIEGVAAVFDEIINLHGRFLGRLFNNAKKKHLRHFQASAKVVNAKVRLFERIGQELIEARERDGDPYLRHLDRHVLAMSRIQEAVRANGRQSWRST